MSISASWTQLAVVRAIAVALWHFLWQGAAIAIALAVALRLSRGARARYAAASLAAVAMLGAFGATIALSIPAPLQKLDPIWIRSVTEGVNAAGGIVQQDASAFDAIRSFLPLLVPYWIAGVLALGVYRLGGFAAVYRLRHAGVCSPPPIWRERAARLAQRIGASRPVSLLESSLAQVPVAVGYLKPVILIPAGLLSSLPAEQMDAILLHELGHIRRADYVVNLAQSLVESLLFYHPAVWWVSRVMRTEREKCCDDLVVGAQGDAACYAAALVALEEKRWTVAPALAATGGNLMNRIRRLLNQPEENSPAAGLVLAVTLLLGAFCLLASAQQTTQPGKPAAQELPYLRWLNEDVVYIIEPKERAAFLRLNNNNERVEFIRQFWLRRDPTPGTPENEFMEEHYRRIAYANQHFSTNVPGWKTDRGHIYISYGPPDEIEAHPDRGEEAWLFHKIEKIGQNIIVEFTDPQHTGDYRMTHDPHAQP